jgi:sodium/potassium-transporting ATPase subunit alpha
MSQTPPKTEEPKVEETAVPRAVAFGDSDDVYDEKRTGGLRPRGVEMKREITQEGRELAAAGYEHLEEQKAKTGPDAAKLEHVDINEHHLPLPALERALHTDFDAKDAGSSPGLTSEEAKVRLTRDGPNILTPPKKKSALQIVC